MNRSLLPLFGWAITFAGLSVLLGRCTVDVQTPAAEEPILTYALDASESVRVRISTPRQPLFLRVHQEPKTLEVEVW